jgi:nucleoside-diphosphate-sugar epimerase
MKALVTGSAGFVGRHMVAELKAREWEVEVCDIADKVAPRDARLIFQEGTQVYDLVVHCAAVAPYRAAIDGQPMNLVGDLLLDSMFFHWAVRTRQKHVVYLSSSAAYPVALQERGVRTQLMESSIDPNRPELGDAAYGLTKLIGERMADAVRGAGVKVTVVRPFSGYGEDQGENWPFGAFIGRALRREDPFMVWGDGTQTRDWIHIDDVVGAILALVEAEVQIPVNLCTGVPTSMATMISMICDQVGYIPKVEKKLDAPDGVHYRVGSPQRLMRYYTPSVTVEEGIRRALIAQGV